CGLHIARRLPRDHRHGIDKSSQIRIGDSALPAVIACCDHAARLQHEAGNDACRTSLLHSALRCLLDLAQRHQHNEQTNKNRTELCRDLIENNLSSNQLSVAQLARWLDCHPDYLCAGFRRTYGCAITTWIARRRLELAAHLLARRELPIAAVGWACGFRDPAYFSRRFRAHFGRPPREWRTAAHSAQPAQAPESGSTG
ncbi:MAG: helix-turn-helix transcriptional regulator, partial [Planctomycetota bacterium]